MHKKILYSSESENKQKYSKINDNCYYEKFMNTEC